MGYMDSFADAEERSDAEVKKRQEIVRSGDDSTLFGRAVTTAANSAAAGWLDDILEAAGKTETANAIRRNRQRLMEENPLLGFGAEAAGFIVPGTAATKVLSAGAKASRLTKAGTFIAREGGLGAIAGAGYADGNAAERVDDAIGGAIGGVAGATVVNGLFKMARTIAGGTAEQGAKDTMDALARSIGISRDDLVKNLQAGKAPDQIITDLRLEYVAKNGEDGADKFVGNIRERMEKEFAPEILEAFGIAARNKRSVAVKEIGGTEDRSILSELKKNEGTPLGENDPYLETAKLIDERTSVGKAQGDARSSVSMMKPDEDGMTLAHRIATESDPEGNLRVQKVSKQIVKETKDRRFTEDMIDDQGRQVADIVYLDANDIARYKENLAKYKAAVANEVRKDAIKKLKAAAEKDGVVLKYATTPDGKKSQLPQMNERQKAAFEKRIDAEVERRMSKADYKPKGVTPKKGASKDTPFSATTAYLKDNDDLGMGVYRIDFRTGKIEPFDKFTANDYAAVSQRIRREGQGDFDQGANLETAIANRDVDIATNINTKLAINPVLGSADANFQQQSAIQKLYENITRMIRSSGDNHKLVKDLSDQVRTLRDAPLHGSPDTRILDQSTIDQYIESAIRSEISNARKSATAGVNAGKAVQFEIPDNAVKELKQLHSNPEYVDEVVRSAQRRNMSLSVQDEMKFIYETSDPKALVNGLKRLNDDIGFKDRLRQAGLDEDQVARYTKAMRDTVNEIETLKQLGYLDDLKPTPKEGFMPTFLKAIPGSVAVIGLTKTAMAVGVLRALKQSGGLKIYTRRAENRAAGELLQKLLLEEPNIVFQELSTSFKRAVIDGDVVPERSWAVRGFSNFLKALPLYAVASATSSGNAVIPQVTENEDGTMSVNRGAHTEPSVTSNPVFNDPDSNEDETRLAPVTPTTEPGSAIQEYMDSEVQPVRERFREADVTGLDIFNP